MASLRDLGLSEYESRAYRALLETGPTTANELSQASDVPMGRIYDVLNGLVNHGLARSQSASRPKKYAPIEPPAALDNLLEERRRELEARADQYEAIVDELVDDLEAAEPVDEPFWTAAVGAGESIDLLAERLAAADATLVMVASTPAPGFDLDEVGERVVAELERGLDRGVEVSVLMRPSIVRQLPERIGERYRTTLQDRDRFHVRTSDDVTGTFTVIDGIEVCIEVPHPLNAEETFAMIDFKDRAFADEVMREFEPRWEGAKPLRL